MLVEASITGLFRTLLIIAGAFVLLRFIGRLMVAKRNLDAERELNARQRKADQMKQETYKKFGKTTILKSGESSTKSTSNYGDAEDVDFEEIPKS